MDLVLILRLYQAVMRRLFDGLADTSRQQLLHLDQLEALLHLLISRLLCAVDGRQLLPQVLNIELYVRERFCPGTLRLRVLNCTHLLRSSDGAVLDGRNRWLVFLF